MNGLIFLDTETTGNSVLEDRLCQVAYSYKNKIYSQYFKPPHPISIKAQSINHITNQMVANKKPFRDSKMHKDLQKILKENILVAHNAVFDIAVLSREGLNIPKFICTLKVARFLDEEGEIPEYNLQFLRYYFELNVKATAHDAKGDVTILEALFNKLFSQMMQNFNNEEKVVEKMIEVSLQPFKFRTFYFGKYKGRKIEEIAQLDKGYMKWLLEQKMKNEYEEEDWIFTLKHYLGK